MGIYGEAARALGERAISFTSVGSLGVPAARFVVCGRRRLGKGTRIFLRLSYCLLHSSSFHVYTFSIASIIISLFSL
jgi:hypothetical protein